MTERADANPVEPRWPVVLTIVVAIILLMELPSRFRLLPNGAVYVAGALVIVPMVAVKLSVAKTAWLRIERAVTLLFVAMVAVGTLFGLSYLIAALLRGSELTGIYLLSSSVALWLNNVLMFSLLFWQIDRGGPGVRVSDSRTLPDWFFPQEGVPSDALPPGWRPAFVDYLFLAFSTATAFSSTDVLPLTQRAKLMMMAESTIALVTLVVVAARAINVLGS